MVFCNSFTITTSISCSDIVDGSDPSIPKHVIKLFMASWTVGTIFPLWDMEQIGKDRNTSPTSPTSQLREVSYFPRKPRQPSSDRVLGSNNGVYQTIPLSLPGLDTRQVFLNAHYICMCKYIYIYIIIYHLYVHLYIIYIYIYISYISYISYIYILCIYIINWIKLIFLHQNGIEIYPKLTAPNSDPSFIVLGE